MAMIHPNHGPRFIFVVVGWQMNIEASCTTLTFNGKRLCPADKTDRLATTAGIRARFREAEQNPGRTGEMR